MKTRRALARAAREEEEKKRPKTWEQYRQQMVGVQSFIGEFSFASTFEEESIFVDEFDDEEMPKAFNAFAKLLKLRKKWVGDWKPDWTSFHDNKYIIATKRGELDYRITWVNSSPMCFPTIEMRAEFGKYFKDLLEIAKPLL